MQRQLVTRFGGRSCVLQRIITKSDYQAKSDILEEEGAV